MKKSILIHPEELSTAWIDRMAASGAINVLGLHPAGGKHTDETLDDLLARLQDPDFRALLDDAREKGLDIEYEMHAAMWLLPRALFAEHPEYFRMNEKGERTPDRNFCPSSEEAMEIVAGNAAKLAHALYGSRTVYYFWLDDAKNTKCHCPRCAARSASDQQLLVVNRMLREIRKTIPQARMAYLAYYDALGVPKTVRPEEGVFLEYAPIEKWKGHWNERWRETDMGDPALIAEEQETLKPLLDFFGRRDAKVLEYWLDNSLFSRWKKPPVRYIPDKEKMSREVAAYRQLGFAHIATFGCYLGEDYEALWGEPDIRPYAETLQTYWK